MRLAHAAILALSLSGGPTILLAGPAGTRITGKVTLTGTLPKLKPLDVSKEPACVKMHAADPLFPETILTGPGNSLRNVVVYISAGAPYPGPAPSTPVIFDQQGCHYTTHVLAFRVGQEMKISNSDPLAHNIHPLAKVNREWNKIQPPGTPAFSYAYDNEEFIPVKCNIHPWMQGYFVVLRTPFFAVTGDDGTFEIPDLPPGRYTITAWHETLGTKSQDITVNSSGGSQSLDFNFSAKP
ncbi:MAG TPA: carboxypeptidase regulatory-like domain-containing protein [Candidatus Acidoferrum sp.]|nr:carboxypeptidase regulatory-like domain-containing protein [Candidatus Acidoferrum sp.]